MYAKYSKRILDFTISLIALIVLSPVLLAVGILVQVKLSSPVLFRQQRPGKDEKIFTMYKFRTMADERDDKGELLPDSVRLTKFGRILRSTSLDELPELINILKGDMSIVGPRPLLVKYLPMYNEQQKRRHEVRPGLTGWAQINGRNALDWERKFMLDVEYVEKVSFLFDCKIFFLTVWKAFIKREGISQEGEATMKEFAGVLDKVAVKSEQEENLYV